MSVLLVLNERHRRVATRLSVKRSSLREDFGRTGL